MEYDGEQLVEQSAALASAARKLVESTADPSIATELPVALAHVGEALEALKLAVEGVPRALVPAGTRSNPPAAGSTGPPPPGRPPTGAKDHRTNGRRSSTALFL